MRVDAAGGGQAARLHPGPAHLRPPDHVAGAPRGVPGGPAGHRRDGDVFAVGGDPAVPMGPYEDSLAVIESGVLQQYGARDVSVGGYPDGHPGIATDVLWSAPGEEGGRAVPAGAPRLGDHPGRVRRRPGALLGGGGARARRRAADPRRRARPGQRQAAARLRLQARHLHVRDDRQEVRPFGHQPARQGGPGELHPRPADGLDPGKHGVVKLHFYTSAASRRRRSGSRTTPTSSNLAFRNAGRQRAATCRKFQYF